MTSYRDHVSVGEIPLEDQRGHVDDEVERVDADHEVPVRGRVPTKWAAETEHVGEGHVARSGRVLDKAFKVLGRLLEILKIPSRPLLVFASAAVQFTAAKASCTVVIKSQPFLKILHTCSWRECGWKKYGDEGSEHVEDKEEVVVDDAQDDVAEVEQQACEDQRGGE